MGISHILLPPFENEAIASARVANPLWLRGLAPRLLLPFSKLVDLGLYRPRSQITAQPIA